MALSTGVEGSAVFGVEEPLRVSPNQIKDSSGKADRSQCHHSSPELCERVPAQLVRLLDEPSGGYRPGEPKVASSQPDERDGKSGQLCDGAIEILVVWQRQQHMV